MVLDLDFFRVDGRKEYKFEFTLLLYKYKIESRWLSVILYTLENVFEHLKIARPVILHTIDGKHDFLEPSSELGVEQNRLHFLRHKPRGTFVCATSHGT